MTHDVSVPPSNTVRAAFYMLGAIASFSSMAVAGRAVTIELDTFELMLYRSIIGIVIVLGIARLAGTLSEINTQQMGLHTLRNVSHFAGQNLWFAAITLIPLTQVFALEFTSPIWVMLLAPIFLGERMTRLRVAVAISAFIGVLIVTRPDFATIDRGLAFAALCAIGFAGSAVFTKILTRTQTITCILFWLATMQAVFGFVCAGWDGDIAVPSIKVIPWVAVVSVAGLLAHYCLTKALSIAPAVIVVPIDFARLPVIAIIGASVYGEPIDPYVILGAVIIFGANYLNIRAEARATIN